MKSIAEQASEWWVTLHSVGCTTADRHSFAVWVMRSPEHVGAYLRMAALMGEFASHKVKWPDTVAEALIHEARQRGVTDSVCPVAAPHAPPDIRGPQHQSLLPTGVPQRRWLPAMAVVVLLIFAAAGWLLFAAPDRYQTGIGEQRSIVLSDGSLVTLNTASRLEVDLQKHRRIVRLVQGEALFEVAHDGSRPFDVIAGDAVVRAVGTRFDVDRRTAATTVTVVEGRVRVTAQERIAQDANPQTLDAASSGAGTQLLAADERVIIRGKTMSRPERVASTAPVTAWTQRRLVFERRPLAEVAEEFNRYNHRKIVIQNADLGLEKVTGVFQANDPRSFLAFLGGIAGVRIERSPAGDYLIKLSHENISP